MTNLEKIDWLDDKLADKTLNFGCRVIFGSPVIKIIISNCNDIFECQLPDGRKVSCPINDLKIIGHPVTLARTLDYMGTIRYEPDNDVGHPNQIVLLELWNVNNDTLEAQSPECINFLFDLFKP